MSLPAEIYNPLIALLREVGIFPDDNHEIPLSDLYAKRQSIEALLFSLSIAWQAIKDDEAGKILLKEEMKVLISFLNLFSQGEYNKEIPQDTITAPPATSDTIANSDARESDKISLIPHPIPTVKQTQKEIQTALEQAKKILNLGGYANPSSNTQSPADSDSDSGDGVSSTARRGNSRKKTVGMDRANQISSAVRRILEAVVDVLSMIHFESLRHMNSNKPLDVTLVVLKYLAWILAFLRLSWNMFAAFQYTFHNTQSITQLEQNDISKWQLFKDQLMRNWIQKFRDFLWIPGKYLQCPEQYAPYSSQITMGLYFPICIGYLLQAYRDTQFCKKIRSKNSTVENPLDEKTNLTIQGINVFIKKSALNNLIFSALWAVCAVGAVFNFIGRDRVDEQQKVEDGIGSSLIVLGCIFTIIWNEIKRNTTTLFPGLKEYSIWVTVSSSQTTTPTNSSTRITTATVEPNCDISGETRRNSASGDSPTAT